MHYLHFKTGTVTQIFGSLIFSPLAREDDINGKVCINLSPVSKARLQFGNIADMLLHLTGFLKEVDFCCSELLGNMVTDCPVFH